MKKLTILFFAGFIFSLMICCKKDPLSELPDDQARIYGRVVEKGSKKPVGGAKLFLHNCSCVFLGGCTCSTIDTLTTDASGAYDFTYKYAGYSGRTFDISVLVPKLYRKESGIAVLAPNTHTIVKYDIEIKPIAWVKVHVKNINPFDEYDKISVNGGWGGTSDSNVYFNKNVDVYFKKEILGNDSIGVGASVTKNNINTLTIQKKYALAHDTTYFEILY